MAQDGGTTREPKFSAVLLIFFLAILFVALFYLGASIYLKGLGMSLVPSAAAQSAPWKPYWGFGIQSPAEAVTELKDAEIKHIGFVSISLPLGGMEFAKMAPAPLVTCHIIFYGAKNDRTFIIYGEVKEDALRAFSYSRMKYERTWNSSAFYVLFPEKDVNEIHVPRENRWMRDDRRVAWNGCFEYLKTEAHRFGIGSAFKQP